MVSFLESAAATHSPRAVLEFFCSVLAGLLCSFNHENVLSIKDLIIPLNEEGQCEDIYIITELLDTDLSKVIYSPQPLIDDHCQYFVYQVSPLPSRPGS